MANTSSNNGEWSVENETRMRYVQRELHESNKRWSDGQEMWHKELDELQEKKRSVVGSRKFNKGEKEWEKEDGERRKNEKAKKKTDEQEKKKAELEKKRKEELEKKAAVKGKGREIVAATDDQVPKRSANTQSEAIQEGQGQAPKSPATSILRKLSLGGNSTRPSSTGGREESRPNLSFGGVFRRSSTKKAGGRAEPSGQSRPS
ncbi:hypothetical protein MMC06_005971 [Schaereria dolodes]|nr:hypothetical protein [Schaereria dolodes]